MPIMFFLESLVALSKGSLDIIMSFGTRTYFLFSLKNLDVCTWSILLYRYLRWKVDDVLYIYFGSFIWIIVLYRRHIFSSRSPAVHLRVLTGAWDNHLLTYIEWFSVSLRSFRCSVRSTLRSYASCSDFPIWGENACRVLEGIAA